MKGDTDKFRYILLAMLNQVTLDGHIELEVNAGRLDWAMEGHDVKPMVCGVMLTEFSPEKGDVMVASPPKGKGPRMTVRYCLPR